MKRKLSRFGEREGLQIIYEAGEEFCFLQCIVDVIRAGLVNAVEDPFKVALDDVQRSAQFMGDIGGEIAPLLVGAFEFGDHVIEAAREPPEFARIIFRDACGEVALRDGIDRGKDIGHRPAKSSKGQAADQ